MATQICISVTVYGLISILLFLILKTVFNMLRLETVHKKILEDLIKNLEQGQETNKQIVENLNLLDELNKSLLNRFNRLTTEFFSLQKLIFEVSAK